MRQFKVLSLLAIAVFSFTACKKEVQDRLPGEWDMIWTSSYSSNYGGSTSTDSETILGTATFNEGGDGIMSLDDELFGFSWIATEDKVSISVEGEAIVFDVLENDRKFQKWQHADTSSYMDYSYDEDFNYTPYEYTYTSLIEVEMNKQ